LLGDLDTAVSEALEALNYNPLAMVYMRGPVERSGLGFQVRRDEPFETLGVSWNGVAFGRDDLQTAFLGGMHHPAIVDRTDAELCSLVRAELAELVDAEVTCLGVHRVRPGMPAYDHSWRHLDGIEPPPGIHLAGNYTARVGLPGRLRQARRLADRLSGSGPSAA
ncbi:MAG: FAD-dependent oxidoreductase, partial [Halobacteriota archaeon]